MIHPSYVELMAVVNDNVEIGEEPVVNSRYSIVCATAKRARQIVDGAEPLVDGAEGKKPLSIAVEELYDGSLKILTSDEAAEEEAKLEKEQERLAQLKAENNEETEAVSEEA